MAVDRIRVEAVAQRVGTPPRRVAPPRPEPPAPQKSQEDQDAAKRPWPIRFLRSVFTWKAPRKLKFTREGKYYVGITLGVGFAAINTGNNLLYLLLGMLVSLMLVSGVMSELSLRDLTVTRRLPTRAQVGRAHLVEIEVYNHKKRVPSYAIEVEDLRGGLAGREFIPLFQPKVSLDSGEIAGVEALARWFRPGHGVLLPQEFLPLLEKAGLLMDLTESMLAQACENLGAWTERGLGLKAAVNVSTLSLTDPAVADRLEDLVQAQGCDPHQVILEVVETGVATDLAPVLNVLARLRLKGFGLSMEGFGSGFSVLQQLSNMPFTELKLDQASMREAQEQDWNRTLVEMSLEMARRLNLRTVAERIETRADWDTAQGHGWDEAQGFFISRPLPGHQIPEWVEAWRTRRQSL